MERLEVGVVAAVVVAVARFLVAHAIVEIRRLTVVAAGAGYPEADSQRGRPTTEMMPAMSRLSHASLPKWRSQTPY